LAKPRATAPATRRPGQPPTPARLRDTTLPSQRSLRSRFDDHATCRRPIAGDDPVRRHPVRTAEEPTGAWMRDPLAVPDGELLTHSPHAAVCASRTRRPLSRLLDLGIDRVRPSGAVVPGRAMSRPFGYRARRPCRCHTPAGHPAQRNPRVRSDRGRDRTVRVPLPSPATLAAIAGRRATTPCSAKEHSSRACLARYRSRIHSTQHPRRLCWGFGSGREADRWRPLARELCRCAPLRSPTKTRLGGRCVRFGIPFSRDPRNPDVGKLLEQ
jgi:hypothetical protein